MTVQPPLDGFAATTFEHAGRSHLVFVAGTGPGVVVVHEVPGIHPGVIEFADRLVVDGYRVYLPSLFGRPGADATGGAIARAITHVCVSREFAILADRTSPVVTSLRAFAAQALQECGGAGVGAVGMCVTGGFALAMAADPAVLAPVLSQPGLPAPVTAAKRVPPWGATQPTWLRSRSEAAKGCASWGCGSVTIGAARPTVRDPAPCPRHWFRRHRDRFFPWEPAWHVDPGSLGADRRARR